MTRLIASASACALAVFLAPVAAQGQNPMMSSVKAQHDLVKGNVVKTAELIPDKLYSFQPTPEVRTVAQLIGHIADASLNICASAGGEKAEPMNAEKTMSTKAELSKALNHAMSYCDKVIANMDDKKAMETMKFFAGGMSTRGMVLAFNTAHNFEHYGNLVTYMRINKIVPPSSAGTGN